MKANGKNARPKVSVVITCFNLGKYLDEAVQSVLSQTMGDFEIIVVNDGSTDPYTNDLLSAYRKPKTRVITTSNRGLSAARNTAIREARGIYLCCLDADDLYEPTFLEKACAALDAKPEVGVVSCWYSFFGAQEYEVKPESCGLEELLVENRLCTASLFRTSAWKAAGGYDEGLAGYPDWELWIDILAHGFQCHIIREFLFRYRVRPGSMISRSNQPENRAVIMERIVRTHEELYRRHAAEVVLGKERIIADMLEYQRKLKEAQEWYRSREAAHEELIQKQIEAKAWYLEQIEAGAGEIARQKGEIARQGDEIARMGGEISRQQGEISRQQGEIVRRQAELDRGRWIIGEREHELRALRGSKAYKLGCAFWDAKRSPRGLLLLPFRLLDLACPRAVKRGLRKIFLIAPGETIRGGWYKLPGRLLECEPLRSVVERIPIPLRNATRAILRTSDERLVRQRKWDGPLVSVVIPCYNYGRYLDAALGSVLGQTFTNHEVIIVDDGSTDPFTVEKLGEIESRRLPRVTVIRQKNQKLPRTRNNGIQAARGKYICCLDADDLLEPTYLEECLTALESGNLDICYSHVQLFGDEDWVWETSAFDPEVLAKQNCVCVGAVYRKSAWEKAGGYDPARQIGYEDWDLWMAMAEKGARGICIPEPLYKYRKHGRSMMDDHLQKHALSYAQLRRNHPALFSGKIRPPKVRWRVVDPLINITPENKDEKIRADAARVLFLLPWMVVGGADVLLLGLVKNLSARPRGRVHIMTTIATPPSMGDSSPLFRQVTPYVYRLPAFLPEDMWFPFIAAQIRHRGIGTVFICGCSFIYPHLERLKVRFPKLRVVDQLFNDSSMGHVANNRKYARWIDETFIAAEKLRRSILSRFGGDPARLRTLYHGTDTALFDPALIGGAEARARFDLPSDKKIILYVGRLSVEKNPLLFVELASALRGEKGLFFVMRGNGPLHDEVTARARELTLGNFRLLDIVPPEDVPAVYRAADLLVLTSLTEGVPLTIFEALAMNVPVVASDVGGISDVVREGVHGFLFRDGDLAGCVEKVRRALDTRFGDLRAEARARYELRDVYARYCEALKDTAGPPLRALPRSAARRGPLSFRRAARFLSRPTDRRNVRQEKWDGPLVSVVIPCHNYGRFIDDALGSVLVQTFSDYEVLIVDDGSTDPATLKKLREIESRNLPRVTIIRQENQQLPRTRNNGIRASRGTYICCLDADDMIEPTYLQKCVTALESGGLDICYSHVRLFGDEERVWETGDFDPETLRRQNCVCVGAVYRKSAWEQAGGYNPDMSLGYEDWDLWLSMLENGAQGTVIPEPLFLYRKHGRSMIDGAQERHEVLCAQIRENHPALFAGGIFPRGKRRRSARRRTFSR